MPRMWVLSAAGSDRPGIVAQVTKALYALGCNLEDSAMTRLGGEFAIMLVCSSAASLTPRKLEAALSPLAARLRLSIHTKPLSAGDMAHRPLGRPYTISVYGSDRPGIVYRISELLARRRINISDLSTRRTSPANAGGASGRASLYQMMIEVELPPGVSAPAVERALRQLAKRLRVEVRLQPVDTAIL